jgi:hypothetical protein
MNKLPDYFRVEVAVRSAGPIFKILFMAIVAILGYLSAGRA